MNDTTRYKLTVSKGDESEKHTFTDKKLAAICLDLCGGGYTTAQTRKAMALQSDLIAGKARRVKGITLRVER